MTSRAEACPNIVLEAMAHGCVSASTQTPPMPEFFEDAPLYYPPGNGKALSQALQKLLSMGNDERMKISEKARSRASQFSWDLCAKKTIKELNKAANTTM